MIPGRDVDIVDIEQNAAIGLFYYFIQELPFGHFRNVELRVAADVFNRNRDLQTRHRLAYLGRGNFGGFECVRHGQEIMRVRAIDTAPAQVICEPRGFCSFDECLEPLQMLSVQWFSGTEIHGYTVLHDFILFEDLIENSKGLTSVNHIVFGDDLKPSHYGLALEDVLVMRDAQPEAYAEVGKSIEAVSCHFVCL